MKKVVLIFALIFALILAITSCSKDIKTSNGSTLNGKWNWVESSGGLAGKTETPATTGKVITIEISNGIIKYFENGVQTVSDSFTTKIQNSIRGENKNMIIYKSGRPNQSFELNEKQLILFDECYDCYQSNYSKI